MVTALIPQLLHCKCSLINVLCSKVYEMSNGAELNAVTRGKKWGLIVAELKHPEFKCLEDKA